MFATLGEITFQTIESPERFVARRKFDYAEHKIAEARPRLQFLAEDLEAIELEMMFHIAFTNPKTQLDLLGAAAEDHQARALVFGNGVHRGYFVIVAIDETDLLSAADGSLIYATARVELKEYALAAATVAGSPPKPAFPPPAIINTPGAGATPAPFNPNAPIGPNNLLPTSAIVALSGLPAGSYQPPAYPAPGVSGIVSNVAASGASGPSVQPGDIPPAQIVS